MTNSLDTHTLQHDKAELRQLYTSGKLSPAVYQILLAALEAQANSASDRSVAATTVAGHAFTGDEARVVNAESYYENYISGKSPGAPTEADLRRAYLSQLWGQTRTLSLTGVDPRATNEDARLNLDAIYTKLLTQGVDHVPDPEPEPQAGRIFDDCLPRPLSAVERLDRAPRLVLLGEPGSGKSTFVNFVALCLAGDALGQPNANLQLLTEPLPAEKEDQPGARQKSPTPQRWDQGTLLPVRILLRDFAARGLPADASASAHHLWTFIESELTAASLGDYAPYLRSHLLQQGGLILLDGLDEVPEAERRRSQLCAAVVDFANTFSRCRILVTSRTYAYQKQAWKLPGFVEVVLAPFHEGQIRAFVERWYAHWAELRHHNRDDAQGRSQLLLHAIFSSERLSELATRPLLLTLMASLHAWRGGTLPDRREELYADAVDLLLDRWESQRIVRDHAGHIQHIQPSLQEFLRIDRGELQTLLNRLAYDAHARQPELTGTADIPRADLLVGLLDISEGSQNRPRSEIDLRLLMRYLSDRSGLLVPRSDNVYSFPHRTFQEYLAAWHLTDFDYPDRVAEMARTDPNRWREVALLAGAKAARGTASAIWSLVDALCFRTPGEAGWSIADEWGAHLAGLALAESGMLKSIGPRHRAKLERVQAGLLHVMRDSAFPALERAAAGRSLATLGDPRREVMSVEDMHFCTVPAGPFEMGEPGYERGEQCTVHLGYTYWLARYPVTNAQYARFVRADGYANPAYWSEARAAGHWKDGAFAGRTTARDYGPPYNLPNHPVVDVSWYESLAFARWLTEHLHKLDLLPTHCSVHLPNEAEWEKAARGGHQIPKVPESTPLSQLCWEGAQPMQPNRGRTRAYPWGDAPDIDRASYDETELNVTSAVGCLPLGISPYGVEELSGTVWEWTRTLYDSKYTYPYRPDDGREDTHLHTLPRVLRGGAFVNGRGNVRCSTRGHDLPHISHWGGGFRVVVLPFR